MTLETALLPQPTTASDDRQRQYRPGDCLRLDIPLVRRELPFSFSLSPQMGEIRVLCVDVFTPLKGCTLSQFYHFHNSANNGYEKWNSKTERPDSLCTPTLIKACPRDHC